jgi:hypothetical protein
MRNLRVSLALACAAALAVLVQVGPAASDPIAVNVDNFARAQADMEFAGILKLSGGVNKWQHNREPTPIDKQNIIRMNRDTLYSFAIIDISKGASVTLPDAGDRYMSLMIINNDGYVNETFHGAGTYELTTQKFDTPYVAAGVRILAKAEDAADVQKVHELQDGIKIEAASQTAFVLPDYDKASYEATLKALLELAKGAKGTTGFFGSKAEVDSLGFLLGSAAGWGGLPDKEAHYINVEPGLPVGEYELSVKDVPVSGFWSISLYNKEGYFQKNDLNAYSLNNLTAKKSEDGSYKIRFGGCTASTENCLPIMDGWNYLVRLYEPHQEILDGKWAFPGPPQPVKN